MSGQFPFIVRDDGIYHVSDDKPDDPPRFVSSRIDVKAETRDGRNEQWGRLLVFNDPDGVEHVWAMPMAMLAGSGTEICAQLLSCGARIAPGAQRLLLQYLASAPASEKLQCVDRPGWHGTSYVLTNRCFRPSAEAPQLVLQADCVDHGAIAQAGTVEDWKDHVASICAGNTRLVFAVAAAFSPPLLGLLGEEGGGFNFRGASSTGKSTALKVAGSVWGGGGVKGYLHSWRATSNGLEGLATGHCDGLLLLDEMGQANARDVGETAYMLGNGAGKQRAGRGGEARSSKTWRLVYLSSSEVSLATLIAQAGGTSHAGQEVRLADIPADAGADLGMFENTHGEPNGQALAIRLTQASGMYYGTPIQAFLEAVVSDSSGAISNAQATIAQFRAETATPSGQEARVAARFALVAAAGEMARDLGIVPWDKGEALRGAQVCFAAWRDAKGGTGTHEDDVAAGRVREYLEKYGDSRFVPLGLHEADDARIANRAGYRRVVNGETQWWLMQETFKHEVCHGLDHRAVAKALKKRGCLLPDSGNRSTQSVRLPGVKDHVRVYVITSAIFNDPGETGEPRETNPDAA